MKRQLFKSSLEWPDRPLRYAISDRLAFPYLTPDRYLELLFRTQADLVQLREKDLSEEECRPLIRRCLALGRKTKKKVLINSWTAAALEEGADGVHLTSRQQIQEALDARDRFNRPGFLIGKSVHSKQEAQAAEIEGADYLLFGPVKRPISKPSGRPPHGMQALIDVVRVTSLPVFAVGGLEVCDFGEVAETGAAGTAGITWVRSEIEALAME